MSEKEMHSKFWLYSGLEYWDWPTAFLFAYCKYSYGDASDAISELHTRHPLIQILHSTFRLTQKSIKLIQ